MYMPYLVPIFLNWILFGFIFAIRSTLIMFWIFFDPGVPTPVTYTLSRLIFVEAIYCSR
jgi:hypothetical protein